MTEVLIMFSAIGTPKAPANERRKVTINSFILFGETGMSSRRKTCPLNCRSSQSRSSAKVMAANLSVWLVSLPWTESRKGKITDNIITRGWADPQNYRSMTHSEPLTPNQFYDITFDLQPDDQVIPKGQQIGLMIFSSDKDFTLWPTPGTELTVDLDATTVTLPLLGGVEAYTEATDGTSAKSGDKN